MHLIASIAAGACRIATVAIFSYLFWLGALHLFIDGTSSLVVTLLSVQTTAWLSWLMCSGGIIIDHRISCFRLRTHVFTSILGACAVNGCAVLALGQGSVFGASIGFILISSAPNFFTSPDKKKAVLSFFRIESIEPEPSVLR